MKNTLAKAAVVACLLGPALASADSGERTYHGNTSSEYISFTLASLSTVGIDYSWADMLLTKNKYNDYENNASSLTWTLTGPTAAAGSFIDVAGVKSYSGPLDLGPLTAGSYKLTLNGSWNPVTLTGSEKTINGWSVTNGKVNITKDSLSIATVTAVPEPQGYAMMLAGLGLMGFIARRRVRAAA